MTDFFLLLLVKLKLVSILLFPSPHVGAVVTTPILEPLLLHDHCISTHAVQEILGVRDDNKNLVVTRKVLLKPHTSGQVKMVSGFIEQEHGGLNEEGLRQGDPHSPSSAHVLSLLLNGGSIKAKTAQDGTCATLKRSRVELVQTLTNVLKQLAVRTVLSENFFRPALKTVDLVPRGVDNKIKSRLLARLSLRVEQVNVDILRDGDLSLSQDLEKSTLPAAVSANKPVPLSNSKLDHGILDEDLVMKVERKASNLDIAGSIHRHKDTGSSCRGISNGRVTRVAHNGAFFGAARDNGGHIFKSIDLDLALFLSGGVLFFLERGDSLGPFLCGLGLLACLLGGEELLALVFRRHGARRERSVAGRSMEQREMREGRGAGGDFWR